MSKAELASSAAHSLKQRDFDTQMVVGAVRKHLRAQLASELARARSRAELCLHAYYGHKLQLIDAQNELMSTEGKLQEANAPMSGDVKTRSMPLMRHSRELEFGQRRRSTLQHKRYMSSF